jgi:hypothetical protein
MVNKWLASGKYGTWCAKNKTCMDVIHTALQHATAAETAAVVKWLHTPTPSSLMQLNWIDTFEADVKKAEVYITGEAAKFTSLVKKLGVSCGGNQICQELASAAINEGVKIENEVVSGWLKNKSWGQWCAKDTACMAVVQEGLQDATKEEKAAIAHWLHPDAMIIML